MSRDYQREQQRGGSGGCEIGGGDDRGQRCEMQHSYFHSTGI